MKDETKAIIAGRRPSAQFGAVNPIIARASTIVSPTLESYYSREAEPKGDALSYGTHGTPGTFALEEAIAALEGGGRTRLCGSGLLSVTAPLLAFLGAGDHLLMVDTVYGPTRRFCDGTLRRLGVETTYYDPLIGSGVRDLIRPNTRVIYLESPGSHTFEVQDAPAIAAVAEDAGVWTIMDNTWASPLYFKPLQHGVDVSIQALTKYISGHADLIMGAVTANQAAYPKIQRAWLELGLCGSPDDAFLAARGLRTLGVRMAQHMAGAQTVADWLFTRPEISDVLYPAMPWDPGHRLWRRDMIGASSLFSIVLRADLSSEQAVASFVDGLELFAIGASWGGYQSMVLPISPAGSRTATRWPRPGVARGRHDGRVLRLHVGLEDPDDLIADLDAGLARIRAAS